MQHVHAVGVLERFDHRGRTGRAADHRALQRREREPRRFHMVQQHLPDRRHTGGICDFLTFDQLIDRLAVHRGAGKHQFAAGECGRVGDAPGVHVEHRHHRKHRVACAQAHHVRQCRRVGMQEGGAVAVERGLRVAGGAARVAHARCAVLIKSRPAVDVVLRADPGFVADQTLDTGIGRQLVRIAQCDVLFDAVALGMNGLHDRQERHVKAQHLIFCMVCDPGDLLRQQPRIDRMQHAAGAAHAEIQL